MKSRVAYFGQYRGYWPASRPVAIVRNPFLGYSAAMPDPTTFQCPNCDAQYKVVRVEGAPTHDHQILCLGCGAPHFTAAKASSR